MSESARTWGLRLLALVIAVSIWYRVSLEDRESLTERTIEASVSYNRPAGFVILNQVSAVNVRLRGTSRKIRDINPYNVDVQVDIPQPQEGALNISLEPSDVKIPEGFDVVSIDPNIIRVELDVERTMSLPVVAQLQGRPPSGFHLDPPEVFPNQVLVTGPESLLARIQSLSTRPVIVSGRTSTFAEKVTVIPPDPLIQVVQPSKVEVRIPIEPVPAEGRDPGEAGDTGKTGDISDTGDAGDARGREEKRVPGLERTGL